MSSSNRSLRRLLAGLILLAALWAAAVAQGRPAGPSGVQPLLAGEEPAVIETTPGDQTTVLGAKVLLPITGKELVKFEAKGLPAGLKAEEVTTSEWKIVGEPTAVTPAAAVALVAENPGHGPPAEVKFNWTIDGIENPGPQKAIAGTPVIPLIVKGVGMKALTAAKPLPPGLELTDVGTSETEWEIHGTPNQPTVNTVELQGQNEKGEALAPVQFTFTVAGMHDPGPRFGTVGQPVEVFITGVELVNLTASPLPPGLKLVDVEGSETLWEIVGTPTAAGETEVELNAENEAKQPLPSFKFKFTIAQTPPPTPPSATGTLAISPAAAFSAARSTCAGLNWTPSTVSTQWLIDGLPISGATAATYVAPRIYDGRRLSCRQSAVTAEGGTASVTSAAATVHEQPPQPYWSIGLASQRCSSPVCMQDGAAPRTPVTRTYQQAGSWMTASQVRCISAPWTSIAGTSAIAAVEQLAEAHSVTVTLVRTTAAGAVPIASQELSSLTIPSDGIDGAVPGSPFAGNIVAGFGSQAFTRGELWPRLFPGSLGKPDRFAAGQGYVAYQVNSGATPPRSFQLVYNLTAADLGAHLHCTVSAKDGPVASPTTATLTSPEYTVSKAASCAPRQVAHIGGPQPATVVVGSRLCLQAPSGVSEIGNGPRDLSVVAGRSAVGLECTLGSGCTGKLTLTSGGRDIATANVSLRRGARKVLSLKLTGQASKRLKKAGSAGLAASLDLIGKRSRRRLASVKLLPAG